MKRVARVAMLGMVLQGSAHAAAPGAAAEPSRNKDSIVKSAPSPIKKNKSVQSKKAKPSGRVGAVKVEPKAKQDSMTETPPESTDQSVQLRGVRG